MKKILAFCIVSAIAIAVVSKACAQAAAAFSTGTFNSDAILSLAGPVSNELYGITWAATTTTGNGYLFTHYNSTTLTYGNGGSDGVFFPSPNTTGDSGFDTILKSAADQGVTGSPNFTLNGLTAGIIYNVLILDADDRTSIGGPRSITVSDGLGHSIAGSNWRDGSGNAVIYGSYILATFTASGATEAFTITGSGGPQVNDVLVIIHGTGPPPPPTNVVAQQSNNGQVSLSWTASVGATSYNVERSTSTGSPYVVIATNLATLTYTDSTAVIGTFYFYAITANNAYATSAAAPAVFGWRVVIPTLNTNELVVTATTPQDYGAVGDGITDDSAAFQAAINAVYNSGGRGGGVVYVPAGTYAFYTNINLLTGVTLHGDWQDWTKGTNGLVGTTFKVYQGAGSTNGSAFLNVQSSASLWGVNIWYPNQDPNNITQYPFSIRLGSDSVLRNIVLVNPYLGVQVQGETKWILSTLIGSPLSLGFVADNCADVCQSEDVRFSPAVWPASKLPGAPAANGPPATWMRTNATAMRLLRLDGMGNMKTEISGFKSGIEFDASVNGSASSCFYEGHVTNCGIALNLTDAQQSAIPQFANFTLAGDVAISHTNTASDVNVQFKDCNITGYSGVAVQVAGNSWQSAMDFMNCNITGTLLANGPGIVNMISCTLNASTQCVMNATVTRTAFTGCTFNPATNIVNNGAATNLVMESRPANGSPLPMVSWTNIINDANSRRPAKVALFLATSYGANGTDSSDDTAAIQNALDAAGSNGGGIVYVPAGKYQLNGGLNVPSGVELRGAYELRHRTWPGQDGKAKGTILQPYSGQGGTNGTPAIVLQPNAGVRGMTITYESQTPYCIQFPPAIQGRGSNVYAIGVQSPNAYWFVDLNTYTCSNHFLFMLDGSFMWRGFTVGNGSSGTVLDCHNNQTYWWDNYDSASDLSNMTSSDTNAGPAYTAFVRGNGQYYDFGNCTEQLIKTFSYQQNIWLHCSSQNGVGANVTGIAAIFDAAYEGFVFEGAGPSTVNMVNMEWMVEVNSGVSGLNSPMAVDSRADYQGTVRIFNSPLHAQPNCGYLLNGGDIGFELVHGWQYANTNININGGVLHMIGAGFFGSNPNITFGANAGIAGKTNEFVGCYCQGGFAYSNLNPNNPVNAWADYALFNSNIIGGPPAQYAASADNPPTESAAMAFDGNTSTKWFNANQGNTGWLRYYFGGPAKVVIQYNISSANDVPGRDPKSWQFQGSHDGYSWATLDTRAGETFPSRFQTKQYTMTNMAAYEFYRLNITTNNGDPSGIQLSELSFVLGNPPNAPLDLTATKLSDSQIRLAWSAVGGVTGYNVGRANQSGGPYTLVASNWPGTSYTNSGLANGTTYYYVVAALNIYGPGTNSLEASAQTISTAVMPINLIVGGNQMQFTWPSNHIGWHLQMQTNALNTGMGTNWVNVPGSTTTNQMTFPVDPAIQSALFRLVYP